MTQQGQIVNFPGGNDDNEPEESDEDDSYRGCRGCSGTCCTGLGSDPCTC